MREPKYRRKYATSRKQHQDQGKITPIDIGNDRCPCRGAITTEGGSSRNHPLLKSYSASARGNFRRHCAPIATITRLTSVGVPSTSNWAR